MSDQNKLIDLIQERLGPQIETVCQKDMVTVTVSKDNLVAVCKALRDDAAFQFDTLIDICGIDYSDYGISHWRTEETTAGGFSRGVDEKGERIIAWDNPRFGSVYHLLSTTLNQRVRLHVYLEEEPMVSSVIDVWAAANWFEREAFDLFGIVYEGHPDLRRLLTDYGFKGHPFRKDFPLIGEVEMRYDAAQARCIYESVSIQPRTTVPKVIRDDNRAIQFESEQGDTNA